MVSSVIVTVYVESLNRALDMELPCNLPIASLEVQILNELRARFEHALVNTYKVRIWYGNRAIDPRQTLAGEGIWDGQYLTLREVN